MNLDGARTALKAQAQALARADLLTYVQRSMHGYTIAPCHAMICDALMRFADAVARGEMPRLAIFMPPRAGKSFIAAERFPAWFLGHYPKKSVIVTSYGYDLASRFTLRARDLAGGQYHGGIFSGFRLSPSVQRADQWETAEQGGYYGVGVGGALTGMGADVLIVDDPVKNWAEALSEAKRRAIWDWYASTAYTRLMPGGGVLLIQTRWHPDDLGGRILEKGGFEVIKVPAIDESGESYDPVRFPVAVLQEIRATIGETAWRCLYQQEPTSQDGQFFKRATFCFHDEPPASFQRVCISVDATFKGGDGSDFVSIQAWGVHEHGYYLLDCDTRRMGFSDTLTAIDSMTQRYNKWNPSVVIEDKANGPAIIETMRRKYSRIIAVNPQGGKQARAQAVAPLFDARRVSFPAKAPWIDAFVNELADFPASKHDDRVDAMTQGLSYLENGSQPGRVASFSFL